MPRRALGPAPSSLSRELAVVFAVHPRTRKRLEEFGLLGSITGAPGIRVTAREALSGRWAKGQKPKLWDGRTAERAARSLRRRILSA